MRIVLSVIATLALTLGTAWAWDHSGTVVSVDREQGILVIGEIGPWHVRDGKTEITHQTIIAEPSTQFVMMKRSREPGPAGWPGEFVEVPLGAWEVKPGDFVTAHVEQKGKRRTATKITVAEAAE